MPTIIGLNGIATPEFLKLIELFSPNENHGEFIYVKELEVVKSLSGFSLLAGDDGMDIEEQFVHNKEDIRVLNKWDLNHD